MKNIAAAENHFAKHGYMVVKFDRIKPILIARNALQNQLRKLTKIKKITLANYHKFITDDEAHTQLQIQLARFFQNGRFSPKIIETNIDFFVSLLGRDLKVQGRPYLRITRPGKSKDNIGYHRDTFYGGSPFELSVFIPFLSLPKESSLSVLPGSHIRPETDFKLTQIVSKDVVKGSEKHKLGFPYAPKVMSEKDTKNMKPIRLNLGEVLIFSLSTVHGSVENKGEVTRWSTDTRVMHALAPVDLSKRPDYYQELSRSIVTRKANEYEAAQKFR